MKQKILYLLLFISLSLVVDAAPPVENGKAIFAARCAACHNINKVLTGPALAGVDQRRSMDWIVSFVRSSQTMVKNGDKDAVDVFKKFNNIPMPDHQDLTAEHIAHVVEYIKSESKTEEEIAPFAKPGKIRPSYTPISINNYGVLISFVALAILLVATLLFAVQVKQYQRSRSGF